MAVRRARPTKRREETGRRVLFGKGKIDGVWHGGEGGFAAGGEKSGLAGKRGDGQDRQVHGQQPDAQDPHRKTQGRQDRGGHLPDSGAGIRISQGQSHKSDRRLMYGWLLDPQMRRGRFCRVCKCEFFGDGEVCARCRERPGEIRQEAK